MYTIDYFIDKFTNIPDELWTISALIDYIDKDIDKCPKCVLGHLGVTHPDDHYVFNKEANALYEIFKKVFTHARNDVVWEVSDGVKNGYIGIGEYYNFSILGNSPKDRVIKVLRMAQSI